ncbi:hypothetical protein DMA11_03450 [Marinilabiliaceae bacterium JC017]|nr:hypothetical protein DMA11_03450 [Marinilabiliaceae bacterium JC017]
MTDVFHIKLRVWQNLLATLINDYNIYAPLKNQEALDYQLIDKSHIPQIIYNVPKPISPLKLFFLPVKENVALEVLSAPNIIIGSPACDLHALDILDEIYLHEPFVDPFYREKRENTILIGTDCHSILEHCHCTSYGIDPYPDKHHDLLLTVIEEDVFLERNSEKGDTVIEILKNQTELRRITESHQIDLLLKRQSIIDRLADQNEQLPDYQQTGQLITQSNDAIWKKYAKTCVACGACATICPTCTCFLLVDRPGFEKIRQMDACQYPGFARIAAGEDPLGQHFVRFRNRYLCKYVWKPEKFHSIACTGCGRCIETCIGNIDKNELFRELKRVKGKHKDT